MSKKSAHESIKVEKGETNIPVRVPGQRRVAMASGNVPDFDGIVVAAAGDKFAVRRKRDRIDPVIETNEYMKRTGK